MVYFLDSVDDLFLFQHFIKPTRFRQGESPSLLDVVFTNEEDVHMVTNLLYLSLLDNSDHICIQFDLACYSEPKKMDKLKYNIRAANMDLMKQTLSDNDWAFLLNPPDINDACLHFKSVYPDTLDHCVPTYKPKEKKSLYSNSEVICLKKKESSLEEVPLNSFFCRSFQL